MRFVFSNDLREHKFLKSVLVCYLVGLILGIPIETFLFGEQFGWTPKEISISVLGSEALFKSAMTTEDLALSVHTFLFFKLVTLITLFALIYRTTLSENQKILFLISSFTLAAISSLSSVATLYIHSLFSYIWWLSFYFGQILILLVIIYCIWFLSSSSPVPGKKVRY